MCAYCDVQLIEKRLYARPMYRKGAHYGRRSDAKLRRRANSTANRHAEIVLCLHHGLNFQNIFRSRYEYHVQCERRVGRFIRQCAPPHVAVSYGECCGIHNFLLAFTANKTAYTRTYMILLLPVRSSC